MVRKISQLPELQRDVSKRARPRARVLAFVSSLAFAPACTLVVGDRPAREEDAGEDAGEQHATVERDAGFDASTREDSGTGADANGASDAGVPDAAPADAALEAGPVIMDAGTDSALIDAGPAPDCGTSMGSLWYPDEDEDSYGRSAEAVQTCARPNGKWATRGGDCKDNDSDVHPEQTTYFEMPYRAASGSDSYDYDCSGSETDNPSQIAPLANGCGLLELIACGGRGYLAGTRTGPNVNPYCGSDQVGTCMAGALGLGCSTVTSTGDRHQCK